MMFYFIIACLLCYTHYYIVHYSKAFDEKGKGVHLNTIKRTEELHSFFKRIAERIK